VAKYLLLVVMKKLIIPFGSKIVSVSIKFIIYPKKIEDFLQKISGSNFGPTA